MKKRHIPLRQCIACSQMKPKDGLLRIVKLDDGKISLDEYAKLPGKGGYICKDKICLKYAIDKKRIEKVFKTSLVQDVLSVLNVKMEELDVSE